MYVSIGFCSVAHSNEDQTTILDSGVSPNPAINQLTQHRFATGNSSTYSTVGHITFNEYSVNTSINDQYKEQGVIFENSFIELDNLPSPKYLSGDNEHYPSPYGNGENASLITATFQAPTNFVEVDPIYLDQGSVMVVDVFDKNDVMIGSTSGINRLKVEAEGIMKATFSFINPNKIDDIAGIDNLDFRPGPIVVIDPGHGLLLGNDGTKHYQRPESPTFGLHEDNLTLTIAKAAKEQLENDGYRVALTRYGVDAAYLGSCGTPDLNTNRIDYCNNDLKARVKIAKKFKEKDKEDVIFVSIHTNGGSARQIRGRTQTFYCFNPSRSLSELLLDEITNIATPIFSLFTGGYEDCGFAVIKKTAEIEISGSLIEVLYHSNLDDEILLNSPWFLGLAGERTAKAIKDFIIEQQSN